MKSRVREDALLLCTHLKSWGEKLPLPVLRRHVAAQVLGGTARAALAIDAARRHGWIERASEMAGWRLTKAGAQAATRRALEGPPVPQLGDAVSSRSREEALRLCVHLRSWGRQLPQPVLQPHVAALVLGSTVRAQVALDAACKLGWVKAATNLPGWRLTEAGERAASRVQEDAGPPPPKKEEEAAWPPAQQDVMLLCNHLQSWSQKVPRPVLRRHVAAHLLGGTVRASRALRVARRHGWIEPASNISGWVLTSEGNQALARQSGEEFRPRA